MEVGVINSSDTNIVYTTKAYVPALGNKTKAYVPALAKKFAISRTGDLIPETYFVWRRMGDIEAFKYKWWNFIQMCFTYCEQFSINFKLSTDSVAISLCSNQKTKNGFKDACIMTAYRKGGDIIRFVRYSHRKERCSTVKRTFVNKTWSFQQRFKECLQKWQENSQFQFNLEPQT